MKEYFCEICGAQIEEEDVCTFDGKTLCQTCFDANTVICDYCDRHIWSTENTGDSQTTLCDDCYNAHYTNCDACGRLLYYDDACYEEDRDEPYCPICYDRIFHGAIKSYNYKPETKFYGTTNLYMGVELEIDLGGENHNNADKIMALANAQNPHLYCKHDGSIENGFEMVSHAMDIQYHRTEMPWAQILEKAISLGYRSHQTSTCGLHVHVNRAALGNDYAQQEETIARIVYFIEAHWNELLKFSRRTEASINRWASRYGLSDNAQATYQKAKNDTHRGRYVCLNLTNYNTIEFRIFRGTLRYETFIATLQLVHEICTAAQILSDKDFENMCWSDFVRSIPADTNPELIEYLKSKQLYVNELTPCGGDI